MEGISVDQLSRRLTVCGIKEVHVIELVLKGVRSSPCARWSVHGANRHRQEAISTDGLREALQEGLVHGNRQVGSE